MDPTQVRTLEDLLAALDHRPRDPAGRAEFDRRIWDARGTHGAILVTDLSGFTKTTRTHGIVHFLSIFRRAAKVCLPIIGEHGGVLLKVEADDLIGHFASASNALHAAVAMMESIRALNSGLEEDERIGLCVGLEAGRFLGLTDDCFGDPVNTAFKLGEDVAQVGEILVGVEAYRQVVKAGFDLSWLDVLGPRTATSGNVDIEHYSIRLANT